MRHRKVNGHKRHVKVPERISTLLSFYSNVCDLETSYPFLAGIGGGGSGSGFRSFVFFRVMWFAGGKREVNLHCNSTRDVLQGIRQDRERHSRGEMCSFTRRRKQTGNRIGAIFVQSENFELFHATRGAFWQVRGEGKIFRVVPDTAH